MSYTSHLNSEENDNDDDLSYEYTPNSTCDTKTFFPDSMISPTTSHKSDSTKRSSTESFTLPASSSPASKSSLSIFKSSPPRV